MFLRFSATNFASVLHRQELSLIASGLSDTETSLFTIPGLAKNRVLPSALIYGANASGKSNILRALSFMRGAVLYSQIKGGPGTKIPVIPYKLSGSRNSSPSDFDIDFVVESVRYHFGFSLTENEVISEWLYSFPHGHRVKLYERTAPREIEFGRSLKGRNRVIADLMRPNSLFFSTALQNDHEQISNISIFFSSMKIHTAIEIPGHFISESLTECSHNAERAIKFLDKIGTGITGYKKITKEKTAREIEMEKGFVEKFKEFFGENPKIKFKNETETIRLKHRGVGGFEAFLDPDEESAGTRRLLGVMSSVFQALSEGSLVLIDELDASIHTRACEAVAALFASPANNVNGAQLIATTHDTNLMLSKSFRRDQIWFTEKDYEGTTHLFPLSDIVTRKGDNMEKAYLQGRFGAIPFSGSVDSLLNRD